MADAMRLARRNPSQSAARRSRQSKLRIAVLVLLIAVCACIKLAPLVNERRLQSASIDDLKLLESQSKNSERVLFYLGKSQERLGQIGEARDSYWRALQLDQDDSQAWYGLARTTESTLGPEQALRVLETALQANPRNQQVYL